MNNLIHNTALMEKLATVATAEELTKVFAEYNIVLEKGVTAQQFLNTMRGSKSDELNEDDLDDVSGGVIITPTIIAAATVAGLSLAAYLKYYLAKYK